MEGWGGWGPVGLAGRTPDPVPSLSSAGVGRTGVFVTLSIVLERMRYEGVVDMFQTVKTLRTQRPAMVQTEVRGPVRAVRAISLLCAERRQCAWFPAGAGQQPLWSAGSGSDKHDWGGRGQAGGCRAVGKGES